MAERQVIVLVPVRIVNEEKGNAVLLFEFPHKTDLMRMDILQAEGRIRAFLGVKAERDPLDDSYIVHCTLLIKIGKCDMPGLLVDLYGSDRCGDLLDERKALLSVFFVCAVDQFFKQRTAQSSCLPGCHYSPPASYPHKSVHHSGAGDTNLRPATGRRTPCISTQSSAPGKVTEVHHKSCPPRKEDGTGECA